MSPSGTQQAQKVLDGMSDAQLCVTLRTLEARFPLDPAETCNGVGISEWHELVYAEWDRRGGTWKTWEGNKRKTVTVSYTVPDHAEHLELDEQVLRMLFADALHEFSRRGTPPRRYAHEYVAQRYANVFKRPEDIERKVADVTLRCDIAEALVLESVKVD